MKNDEPTFISLVLGVLAIVSVFFTIYAYLIYKKIKQGKYLEARTHAFILGVFGLFPAFGAILGGIFFFLTYLKLGEILRSDQEHQI